MRRDVTGFTGEHGGGRLVRAVGLSDDLRSLTVGDLFPALRGEIVGADIVDGLGRPLVRVSYRGMPGVNASVVLHFVEEVRS